MTEQDKEYYMNLFDKEEYSMALQYFIKHSGICKDMTVGELAEHYAIFKHHVPEDTNGLARAVIREMTDITDLRNLLD